MEQVNRWVVDGRLDPAFPQARHHDVPLDAFGKKNGKDVDSHGRLRGIQRSRALEPAREWKDDGKAAETFPVRSKETIAFSL